MFYNALQNVKSFGLKMPYEKECAITP